MKSLLFVIQLKELMKHEGGNVAQPSGKYRLLLFRYGREIKDFSFMVKKCSNLKTSKLNPRLFQNSSLSNQRMPNQLSSHRNREGAI